ncbi:MULTISPECIES: DUF1150 family protein [Ruegeria]|jgi:hypothetical protein|uniref:DUF1150 family protein n=1 Tax=Ruegeria TaxID=97050 RepID=UPI00148965C3|nr:MULTISPECIES: DUF1150 family protein [Ruegeria]MCA0905611.1 DUF1150 domain-containing protein [Ruegeria marisrubri]NOC43756.1 DUF1150 family protein [Ruegeria sp. HKCCD7559]NOC91671.1 DUF1150 family protein [Ruegeria sp. HKCCD6604]NOD84170.1 DUF1150 family protein [Ruegeria sp. HKCCD6119]NOE24980.1 DUF1150 family protein [Ruegeria sp. HKCCD6157]
MNTPIEINAQGNRIVYVKTVEVSELPREVREQAGDLDQLYAVHDSDGQQLALVADRKLAFVLAREHDLSPVAVH